MRRIAIFLTLLLGAAAVIVWCLREKIPPAGVATPRRVDAAEDHGPKDGGAADRADDPATAERSRLEAPGTDSTTWHLRFVAEGSRTPLAGVEVHWADAFRGTADLRLFEQDFERFHERYGRRDLADAQGRLDLVTKDDVVTLAARHQDRYAERLLRLDSAAERDGPFAGERVIELPVDRQLTLRAVDPRGNAVVGALLVVDAKFPQGAGPSRFTLDPTDAEGLAVLRHSHTRFHGGVPATASARALLAADEGPPVDVDLRFPPAAPVPVSLPDTGSLEVVVQWPDGRPWTIAATDSLTLRVRQEAEANQTRPSEDSESKRGIASFEFDHEGRALVTPVQCGSMLVIETDTVLALGGVPIDGPKIPGERVQAVFRLRADTRVLCGRILRADHSPFVGGLSLIFEGERASRMRVGTAPDGRFTTLVPWDADDRCSLCVQHLAGGIDEAAEVDLHAPLAHGINELGDIVLMPPQVLVAGRVVDMAGKPVDGVEVTVQRARVREPDRPDRVASAKTDASGHFEVRGQVRTGRHQLGVRGDILDRDPIEFEPGTNDLTVRVARGASLTATILSEVDPPVVLLEENGTARWMPSRGKERHDLSDGRYRVRWTGLTPGPHHLVVECPGCPPILELAVDVPADGEADDARLRDIDLRGRIRLIAIQVRGADGRPLGDESQVFVHGVVPEPHWIDTMLWPFDVSQPVELAVLAKDHRGRILSGVFGDTTVVLEPAPTVKLSLTSLASLPEGVTAEVHCESAEPSILEPSLLGPSLDASDGNRPLERGCATLRVEAATSIHLSLVLHARDKDDCSLAVEPGTIDPVLLHDGQVIALACDANELQKALASLTGR